MSNNLKTNLSSTLEDRQIVITRVFDAPPELVFNAWTDSEHIGNWWGPNGFTITTHLRDVRPGGTWTFIMHGPDGTDYPNKIDYLEVVKPERLVYKHGSGEQNDSGQFHVTVTFSEQNGKTLLTMCSLFPTVEERNKVVEEYGAIEGGKQTLSRLAEFLDDNVKN
ncbi:SRPBCC family protein [Bacillus sp. EAC]|uniref:SRPBCC family protein n=1 Tax=Bacillus sp. EAC TaxID=1978338 RepID=UPI00211AC53A|nr:SRPBCC family protein [Bacillus sp. EAC]